MKWNEVFCHTFKALRQQIEPEVRKQVDFMLPSMPMVEACRADDFDFFQPLIASGKLTIEQMHHAAQRYFLGKTKSGQPIFWMIDDMLEPLDAHIGTTWLSTLLKTREPLLSSWFPQHCLFGLHLLNASGCSEEINTQTGPFLRLADARISGKAERMGRIYLSERATGGAVKPLGQRLARGLESGSKSSLGQGGLGSCESPMPVGIVEREITAAILSELFPEFLWMSYMTPGHLEPSLFAPLEGQSVTLFPRTDSSMSNYLFSLDLADHVCRLYDLDITVDTTLEDHASDDQKSRCIDILDFLCESP